MITTIYAPLGMLGYGFPPRSLEAAVARKPDVFAMDAGSTDPGPYYLGSGTSFTSRTMVKRDLSLLLPAARDLGVPFIVGSAGGAGGRPHVEWTLDIVREVVLEQGLRFQLAVIDAELPKEYVLNALRRGAVVDFEAGRELTPSDIDACERIVAQMGAEPLIEALRQGAEVVVAGRALDAAIAAALPLARGVDPGIAFHMGKIVECGSQVALPRTSDGVLAHVFGDSFVVEPADPEKRSTVELVAAHTLYEKSDPYHLLIPGGSIDVHDARFVQEDERSVRVTGSRFIPADRYFIKLEGAALVGFRAIAVAGTRDPFMIAGIDEVTKRSTSKVRSDLDGRIEDSAYKIRYRVYGRDGVMGSREPSPEHDPHELGLVIEVVGSSQEIANTVCALVRSATLHMGYEGRIATAGNLAFPYSPAEFPMPPAYEFRVYHLLEVDDPLVLFPIRWLQMGGDA